MGELNVEGTWVHVTRAARKTISGQIIVLYDEVEKVFPNYQRFNTWLKEKRRIISEPPSAKVGIPSG